MTVLSFHASYRCQEHGVCCTSGWPIDIDDVARVHVEAAVARGDVATSRPPFVHVDEAGAPAVLAVVDRACVFHRDGPHERCEIHRVLGHAALPLACRQFPRVSVQDPRGTSITLSHYCPTAASMLDDDRPIAIVSDAPAFPRNAEYVGLDARTSLPPRLRPDMLMDWNSWWEWERLSVNAIARALTASDALARLHAAVEHARTWRPTDGPLIERVREAFDRPVLTTRVERNVAIVRDELVAAIPANHRPSNIDVASTPLSDAALRRYLSAHAFASWTAHLGQGLRTWLRSIEAAHALVMSGLSVGDADLWLRHLADPSALADVWSKAERTGA
jgi:hypothetical protein